MLFLAQIVCISSCAVGIYVLAFLNEHYKITRNLDEPAFVDTRTRQSMSNPRFSSAGPKKVIPSSHNVLKARRILSSPLCFTGPAGSIEQCGSNNGLAVTVKRNVDGGWKSQKAHACLSDGDIYSNTRAQTQSLGEMNFIEAASITLGNSKESFNVNEEHNTKEFSKEECINDTVNNVRELLAVRKKVECQLLVGGSEKMRELREYLQARTRKELSEINTSLYTLHTLLQQHIEAENDKHIVRLRGFQYRIFIQAFTQLAKSQYMWEQQLKTVVFSGNIVTTAAVTKGVAVTVTAAAVTTEGATDSNTNEKV